MTLVRVRRQGNSTVVTLAQDVLEKVQLKDGDMIEERVDAQGRILLQPVTVQPRVRPHVAAAIKRAVAKDRRVLDRLAEHDRR